MPTTASEVLLSSRIGEVREVVRGARASGASVGLVPTMGFLHEGHLRLVDEARRRTRFVVMTIFVNPLQFGPGEDLAQYPRDRVGDVQKATSRGVDLVFAPAREEMYPRAPMVTIAPGTIADRWEGAARPGHFAGVLTVVAKLFNIVQPDVAVFGQKDIQQASLVRAMARDLDFPVDVAIVPTVRDADGLALSSRNSYLSADDRDRAPVLARALGAIAATWKVDRATPADGLLALGREVIAREPSVRLEYLAIVDPLTFEAASAVTPGSIAIIAARLGETRLIDNLVLDE